MSAISVSAYSLREQLGPIAITFTDASGQERVFAQDFPRLFEIVDVPARAASEYAVSGVEAAGFQFLGADDPALTEFARGAAQAGLTLVNVAVDAGDLLREDAAGRRADIDELKTWIDRLAGLGFRFVRVNPGSPFSPYHGEEPPAHLIAALKELGEYANERRIRLLVENHGGPSSDPRWMTALLDAVGAHRLGLLLDLGNFDALMAPLMAALFAEPGSVPADPFADLDLAPLYEGIEALAGRAELVHVKAHLVDDSGVVGPVDVPRALAILARHGYDGWLTIEYEGQGGDPWAKTGGVIDATASVISAGR